MDTKTKYYFNKYKKYKNKYLESNLSSNQVNNIDTFKLIKAIAFFNGNLIKGTVEFEETFDDVVSISIDLRGFEPNSTHGFHVHESGDMTKGCESMCAHFNPFGLTHGGRDDIIRHVGDLGNITANNYGIVQIKFTDHMIKLRGEQANIIGRGLVIHEGIDDCGKTSHQLSKITGNSGKRIECAIIGHADIK